MLFVQCCSLGLQLILCITDNWLSYRATWNAQNRELALRDAGIGPYEDTNDRNALVVKRADNVITREGSEWYIRQAKELPKTGSSHS